MPESIARNLLSLKVAVVYPDQKLRDASAEIERLRAQHCAVVSREDQRLVGLVRLGDVAAANSSSTRIFADMVSRQEHPVMEENEPATKALKFFDCSQDEQVVVVDSRGAYCGLITLESAWSWLVAEKAAASGRLLELYEERKQLTEFLETKIEQRTGDLRKALEGFKAASYALSHDVRAPLRAIRTFAEALAAGECGELNAEGVESAGRIQRAAGKLEVMAEEILGRARTAYDAAPAALETVDLDEVLADALQLQATVFEQCGARIEKRGRLGIVAGRYVPLLQVVANLLTNAAKYVPEGRKPEIEVWTVERGDEVLLHVKDNGRGIAPEVMAAVFRPFYRLDGAGRQPGTGLGLAIARNAVQAIGGDISLESEEDSGTVFRVALKKPEAATET